MLFTWRYSQRVVASRELHWQIAASLGFDSFDDCLRKSPDRGGSKFCGPSVLSRTRMKLHNPHSLQSFQSPVEGWWTWGCQNMVHLQDPASLLNWLRHLLEMRLSEGWPLVRQQWRCRKGRRWWCGLLSYPMGLVGDRGEAFPDNDRHPFPINFQRHWKFPLGKLPGCHQMPSVSRLPDPFCYLLRHDTAGALKKNQWKSAVHWDVGMGQTSGA